MSKTVEPDIRYVVVANAFEGDEGSGHVVGFSGVTRIEKAMKNGPHCELPYIRVWKGDHLHAEYCQHNIVGIIFKEAAE